MAVTFQPSYNQPKPKVQFGWINESWQLFTPNAGNWILGMLIVGAISAAVGGGGFYAFGLFQKLMAFRTGGAISPWYLYTQPGYWVVALFSTALSAFFNAGFMRMANALVRRQPVELGMLFSGGNVFIPMFLYSILYNVIYGVGVNFHYFLLLLIVPLLSPAVALIADGVPLGQALTRAFRAFIADPFLAILFTLVYFFVMLVSCIPCFLGLFATVPMGFIIYALVYRDMIGMPLPAVADSYQSGYGSTAQPGVWPPAPGQQAPPNPGGVTPLPFTPSDPAAQNPSPQPPLYQTPLAGAPKSTDPDEPEIDRADGSGTTPGL